MEKVSIAISILFLITTAGTLWLFYQATNQSQKTAALLGLWVIVQTFLGLSGFYQKWDATPPRFALLIFPAIILIVLLFLFPSGRKRIDELNIKWLTLLHVIRIPVEITLYFLLRADLIPRSMTFEGSNFDILSGLSTPFIYYLAFHARKINFKVLLLWNFACLGLLLNVVTTAILSAKTPFQQFAFDQPNIGVTYFPFIFLPGLIVPVVLFAHLASIRQLLDLKEGQNSLQVAQKLPLI